ncbi:unnamed protein product [Dibothriocephalus latus]|uniref:Deoxyribonuclease n=1 Tax=Dibothriocephalus latus TaxID=60516 RepID=A0A3P7LGQ4_DIBLA|nr:unnamed protein product [Dibothriocephalus latus]
MPKKIQLIALILCISACSAIKMASFNIQVFGKTKSQKSDVMELLSLIIRNYDLVFIQEIRDGSSKAFKRLLMFVNNYTSPNQKVVYAGTTSPRYGRSSSKEQYGIIFNPKKVKVIKESEVKVSKKDFERPPYCYSLKTVGKTSLSFAALAIHIDPDDVSAELDKLYSTVPQCTQASNTANIIVLGDMNAGCSYLPKKKKEQLQLFKDTSFKWMITDDMDTTVAKKDCPYDRFIVQGKTLLDRIVPNSAKPMKFDKIFNLNQKFAKTVSDHYPIEMEIR